MDSAMNKFKRIRRKIYVICVDCYGTGKFLIDACERCKGTGDVEKVIVEFVSEDEVGG